MTARKPKIEILVVEDNPDDAELISLGLRKAFDARLTRVDTAQEMEAALDCTTFDLAICDFRLPNFRVADAYAIIEERGLDLPCIVVSGSISQDEALELMERGFRDYLSKDNLHRLVPAIRRELRDARVRRQLIEAEQQTARARAKAEAAEQKAKLVEELEKANRELRDTQTQLVQSAKMASLGELVAGIAHEVNNPLAFSLSHLQSIGKWLGEIEKAVGGLADGQTAEKLDKTRQRTKDVLTGLERVRDLVIKLRIFSRLDEGEFELADVEECINSTLALLYYKADEKISITTRFAEDNSLYCAPGALNQVIMNIVSNAIDALDGQGTIEVSTCRGKDAFRIAVADNGPGIPASERERVFEPFFTTKDVGEGTGLGLAIAYKIVERHKGSIAVHDRDGGGTIFKVTIPTNLEVTGNVE